MKRSIAYGVALLLTLVAGGVFYSTVGIAVGLKMGIQWTVAIAAGLGVYILWGLAERMAAVGISGDWRPRSLYELFAPTRRSSMFLPRVGFAIGAGLLSNAFMHNARHSTLYDSVTTALFTLGVGAAFALILRRRLGRLTP